MQRKEKYEKNETKVAGDSKSLADSCQEKEEEEISKLEWRIIKTEELEVTSNLELI